MSVHKQGLVQRVLHGTAAAILLIAFPHQVHADEIYTGEKPLAAHQFIYFTRVLAANATEVIETRNTTAGGDPVMQLFDGDGTPTLAGGYFNDDGAGGLDSKLTISGGSAGTTWRILVRSFTTGSAGKTDVYVNGSRVLTQATFGGVRVDTGWTTNQVMRATGVTRGAPNDTMLLLINSPPFLQTAPVLGASMIDDDSGPNAYSTITPTAASIAGSHVVFGLFPGSTGSAHFTKMDNPLVLACFENPFECYYVCSDSDGDCVTNGIESLVGMRNNDWDTDNDHIADAAELFGNDGWSYSEGGLNPTRGNIYVELDYMDGGTLTTNQKPYAGLASDAASIFSNDGGKRIDVLVDTKLAFTPIIKFGSCSGSCINFSTVKKFHFAQSDSWKRQHFHYMVFGAQSTQADQCYSGIAETLGNDAIVSLDRDICHKDFSTSAQRGTFMHELGHNLDLSHSGNADRSGRNGTAHKSVMNYRYQFDGTDNRTGIFKSSYSLGTHACTPCLDSPKKACLDLRAQGKCNTEMGTFCDCDVSEWPRLDLDFSEDPGNYLDGAPQPGFEDPAATARRRSGTTGKDLDVIPDSRVFPGESDSTRRARILRRIRRFEAEGRRRGVDFEVSEDGLQTYVVD